MDNKKLMIIDGNSIINRAFYGVRILTNAEGLYTNAIYGFLNILFKYLDEENPQYLCIAFDLKAPTFRHLEYKEYKAQRKGMPEELAVQLPVLKDLLKTMNIPILQMEGYEADDIIGTMSRVCEENDTECVIVTGDKDSLQLASGKTRIKLPVTRKGITTTSDYDDRAVIEKYGVTPKQFIEVKGLMGDASDNIPGVPGIGEKTALQLIKEYSSIEELYQNIEVIKGKRKENLVENKAIAFLSRKLATIDCNVPIELNISDYLRTDYNKEEFLKLLKRLEFKTFIKRLSLESLEEIHEEMIEETNNDYKHITTIQELHEIVTVINNKQEFIYLLYTDETQAENELISIAINVYYEDRPYVAYIDFNDELSDSQVIEVLKPIFENKEINKIGHNIKNDIVLLHQYGVKIKGINFDTMIGAYIINPSRNTYQIDELAQEFIALTIPSKEMILGKGKKMLSLKEVDKTNAVNFACRQVSALLSITDVLKKRMKEYDQEKLYYEVELPLVEVLADMQIIGFKVDKEKLLEFSETLDQRIHKLTESIHAFAGEEFNINSPKQLGVILFEKLELPVIKKTKTGYSTNVDVLEKLKGKHPIIEMLMEYRQLVKLKSTYADGLVKVINEKTGKIHSSLKQTVTVTGRISSTEPNLQNIPIRLELGREIRKMFVASNEEYVLIDADYSQIELRVLAHISEDPNMIKAFVNNEDIHRRTASQVFNVPMAEVTSLMRTRAKAVNFGIVYGIGDFSLSQDLGIKRKEAKQYIDGYLEKYSNVKQYMTDIVDLAKDQGYVTTLMNRRRYIPELHAGNFITRSFGQRISMNTPIQGSAADIIKIAMVKVYRELKSRKLKSRLILQVHDELIVETHKSEVDEVKVIVQTEMENAFKLKVPMGVDINIGHSWYDAK